MSSSLDATIEQAQAAFSNGDYRSVVESCSQVIHQYPHHTAAQRLLGLAYLEQGQSVEAEIWFARLLTHDPRDPAAYLGLGLIAEERGVFEHALAYCQVAWELAPYDDAFRAPINRVAEKRYGSDGRLRLTHAALAQIHINASRLRRAVKEYQTALTALTDRIDLWMGLAEALWILGENADAAEISREFLKNHSELVPALVILTDLEHRTGDAETASSYRERLRRVDPDSGLTAAMIARHPDADAEFLLLKPENQPRLDKWTDSVVSERPRFAPAPDFTYQPHHAAGGPTDIDELEPMRLEEFTDEAPDTPDEPATSSFLSDQAGLEESGTGAQTDETPGLNLIDMDIDDEQPPFSDEAVDEEELEGLLDDLEGIEPMSLDDFGASDDLPAPASSGFFENSEIDFDFRIDDPDAVQIGRPSPGSVSPQDDFPELPAVDESSQAAEPDEDSRDTVLLPESDEPDQPPPEPTVQPGTGFTRLLGELGEEGLAPFDPAGASNEPAHPERGEPAGEPAGHSLAEGWDEIDAELASATPADDPGDDHLIDFDDPGLEPFTLDEVDQDRVTSVEPTSGSESGEPADSVPADAADILSAEVDSESIGTLDDVPGIEPFDIDEFDDLSDAEGFDFGALPWEEQDHELSGDEVAEHTAGQSPDSDLPARATEQLDVTKELSSGAPDPHFESRMAEVEEAARQNLDQLRRERPGQPDDAAVDDDPGEQTAELHRNVAAPSPERLAADESMFQRTRAAKTGLIEQGIISGDREFASPSDETQTPEPLAAESEATDLDALQAAIESNPGNDATRWRYGEALRENGEIRAAFSEYRWLIRHAPERHDAIISSLEICADNGQEEDLAHRLLADIYRRRGDTSQARNHASMAMATRRLMRDVKM